jgi:hypothetical protein
MESTVVNNDLTIHFGTKAEVIARFKAVNTINRKVYTVIGEDNQIINSFVSMHDAKLYDLAYPPALNPQNADMTVGEKASAIQQERRQAQMNRETPAKSASFEAVTPEGVVVHLYINRGNLVEFDPRSKAVLTQEEFAETLS